MHIPELVETARLRLERWDVDRDTPDYTGICADAEVMRFLGGPAGDADAREHSRRLAADWETSGFGVWAVYERESLAAPTAAAGSHADAERPHAHYGAEPSGTRARARAGAAPPAAHAGAAPPAAHAGAAPPAAQAVVGESGAPAGAPGQLLGYVGLASAYWIPGWETAVEVGWRLRRSVWGRGYATEGAHAAVAAARDRLGLAEVHSFIDPDNTASARVAEKLGLAPVDATSHPRRAQTLVVYRREL